MSGITSMRTGGYGAPRRPAGFGVNMSSVMSGGGGAPQGFRGPVQMPTLPSMMQPPPIRKLSVGEYTAMRERGPQGSNIINPATGQRLTVEEATARMPQGGYSINLLGSAGFGDGRRGGGQQQRNPIRGYSFANQGTAADYFRENGGMSAPRPSLLNQHYLNQPGVTMGAHDRLQAQQAMDMANPAAAFFADQAAVANGQGAYDKSDFFRSMLQDEVAQSNAFGGQTGAQGGYPMADTMAPQPSPLAPSTGAFGNVITPAAAGDAAMAAVQGSSSGFQPGETRQDEQGNTWKWNPQLGRGELVRTAFADAYAMNQQAAGVPRGTFVEGENLGEGQYFGPYGTASVTQDAIPTTFTNGLGSSLGGVQFPGARTGTQSAADFFRDSADFTGQGNRYAAPSPGYGGTKDNSASWQNYRRIMATKDKLKA